MQTSRSYLRLSGTDKKIELAFLSVRKSISFKDMEGFKEIDFWILSEKIFLESAASID